MLAIIPETQQSEPVKDVHFVRVPGATVVLSAVPRKIISLPQGRKQALINAAFRQSMLEACMPFGPVLVVRPDFYIAPQDVASFVAANQPVIDDASARLIGKVQYQISVEWSPSGVLERFRDTPDFVSLFAQGRTTPDALQLAVTALADRLNRQNGQILDEASTQTIALPITGDTISNYVVLIDAPDIPKLDHAVEAIDDIWTDGFKIKQVGPAPAASFALLDPVLVSPAQIQKAMQDLNCASGPSANEITRLRREALLQNPESASQIKQSAAILYAAGRAGRFTNSIVLCTVRSDDQASFLSLKEAA
jgi:hypothetical protein